MSTLWSEREDAILQAYYAVRGPSWAGWSELLPNRTVYAIKNRAHKLGFADGMRNIPKGGKIDPYEHRVIKLMNEGLSPTEIDKALRIPRGASRQIMSDRWKRDKDEQAL